MGVAENTDNEKTEEQETEKGLKRQINLFGAIGLLVGTIIGSGIFISPSVVAKYSGSTGLLLIVWVGCGVIALFSALSYVELGTMFPSSSGSEYDFLYESFGELPAFVSGFTTVVVLKPMSFVMVTLTCADYTLSAFGIKDDQYSKLVAASLIGIIFVLNCASVKMGTIVTEIFTAVKVFALIMIAVTGIVRFGQGYTQNFREPFKDSQTSISQICYAFYGGFWAYRGYSNLPAIAAEMNNPLKDLPKAMWFGMTLVTACYVTVNAAYLTVMTASEIAVSNAVGVRFGKHVYGPMAWIIPLFVACSTFGSLNGNMISCSRMLYAIARKGHVPKFLSLVHKKRHTPFASLLFISTMSWIMLIPKSSNFASLLNYSSFINSAINGATMLALLWLRYRRPNMKRPFKIFMGFPIFVLICSLYFMVAPFFDYPFESLYCLIGILFTIPVYFIFVKYQVMPKCCSNGLVHFALFLQKFNMEYPTEEEPATMKYNVLSCAITDISSDKNPSDNISSDTDPKDTDPKDTDNNDSNDNEPSNNDSREQNVVSSSEFYINNEEKEDQTVYRTNEVLSNEYALSCRSEKSCQSYHFINDSVSIDSSEAEKGHNHSPDEQRYSSSSLLSSIKKDIETMNHDTIL